MIEFSLLRIFCMSYGNRWSRRNRNNKGTPYTNEHQKRCFKAAPHSCVFIEVFRQAVNILANAAKCLKDNQYKLSSLFISDDFKKKVREQRKKLKEKCLDDLRKQDEVEFAYVA